MDFCVYLLNVGYSILAAFLMMPAAKSKQRQKDSDSMSYISSK